jgi:hypothetical protein
MNGAVAIVPVDRTVVLRLNALSRLLLADQIRQIRAQTTLNCRPRPTCRLAATMVVKKLWLSPFGLPEADLVDK